MSGQTGGVQVTIQRHYKYASWNFKSQSLSTVYENRKELIKCVNFLSRQRLNQASAISQNAVFLFWLTVFKRIIPHGDILYNQLQKTCTDSVQIQENFKTFEDFIQKERDSIDWNSRRVNAS